VIIARLRSQGTIDKGTCPRSSFRRGARGCLDAADNPTNLGLVKQLLAFAVGNNTAGSTHGDPQHSAHSLITPRIAQIIYLDEHS
jgi:hypothetical protein